MSTIVVSHTPLSNYKYFRASLNSLCLAQLIDNAEALQANVEWDNKLSESLKTFNKSLPSFLDVLTGASFWLAQRRAEENALMAMEAVSKAAKAIPPMPLPDVDADKTTYTENADHEMMFMTTADVTSTSTTMATTKLLTKAKKKAKPSFLHKRRRKFCE
ncbi:hypothetical protein EDD17DRAFT_1820718 [Pisolithus thermaeus]|nr:hypothetical protein EDD17DRAFT_1820718 [Pisolithus thermaeus]